VNRTYRVRHAVLHVNMNGWLSSQLGLYGLSVRPVRWNAVAISVLCLLKKITGTATVGVIYSEQQQGACTAPTVANGNTDFESTQ
jgi:hypothetical protein